MVLRVLLSCIIWLAIFYRREVHHHHTVCFCCSSIWFFFQENILIRRGVWNVCVWVSIGLVNRHCCILFDVLHQKVAITVCHFLTVNDFYRSIPSGEALFLLFKGNSSWIYGENWMIYLVFFFLGRFHHNHMALLK